MLKKYSVIRSKLHFIKKNLNEKKSIFFEKKFLSLKDRFRFVKLDCSFIFVIIEKCFLFLMLFLIFNYLGNFILFNDKFREVKIISCILESLSFVLENYNQFLLACLGVGGFLVALFLSNLSGVITSKYVNITSKISVSILQEYANRKYLDSMINYLCFIIVQLCFIIFSVVVNPFVALLSVFLTIRIIIIYFELAKRVFLFSDMNMLAKTIYQEINVRFRYLKVAIEKNKSDSIFNSYGNQIIDLLSTLDILQNEMIKNELTDNIPEFSSYIFGILVKYSEIKNLIPSDSKWYRIKYDPVNWFEADSFEVRLRTTSGTFINNKPIINHYFLEEYIENLFVKSIDYLITNNKTEDLYKVFNYYYLSLDQILANCGDFSYWVSFDNRIANLILDCDLSEDDNYEGIVEFICLNKICIVLDSQKYLKQTYENYIKTPISELGKFLISDSKNDFLFVNNDIVTFMEKLQYEKEIEGKIISSDKYIYEYLCFNFINELSSIISILDSCYDSICSYAKRLVNKKYFLSSCLIYSKIIEIENKLLNAIDEISSFYRVILDCQHNFKFKHLEFDKLINKIKKEHYLNLVEYAKSFLASDKCDFNNSKIDFCGQIFFNFSESVFETIISNDLDNFSLIYPYYSYICLMSESFLRNNLDKTYNINYLVSKYKIPLITLMDLNGCVIFHSHVVKDERWENVIKDNFSANIKKDNELKKRMVLYASLDINSFDMNGMFLDLKNRYSKYLYSNGLIKIKPSKCSMAFHNEIDSNDELIIEFAQLGFDDNIDFYYNFYELFIVLYVNPLLKKDEQFECRLEIKMEGEKNDK